MGLKEEKEYWQWLLDLEKSNTNLYYKPWQELDFFMVVWWELWYWFQWVYPQSIEDIQTLIRLLSPNN